MSQHSWLRAAALLPLLALTSCALPLPQVDDIAFVSAELVKESDIPKQDRDAIFRSLGGPFLRITVTSSHDFQKLAHDWNYTIGNLAAACSGGGIDETKILTGWVVLYDRHGPVSMYDKRNTSSPGQPFRYHVYVAVKAEYDADLPANVRQYSYDLAARPQDICLRINGLQEVDGDGWGFAKFRSNVVRIAKGVVAKVLR